MSRELSSSFSQMDDENSSAGWDLSENNPPYYPLGRTNYPQAVYAPVTGQNFAWSRRYIGEEPNIPPSVPIKIPHPFHAAEGILL